MMGLDGVNSTLMDFGYPYAYEPDNRLRLASGLLMGVTLGVMLCYLIGATLWAYVRMRRSCTAGANWRCCSPARAACSC